MTTPLWAQISLDDTEQWASQMCGNNETDFLYDTILIIGTRGGNVERSQLAEISVSELCVNLNNNNYYLCYLFSQKKSLRKNELDLFFCCINWKCRP